MTTPAAPEPVRLTANGFTLEFDLAAMLRALDTERYVGTDFDDDPQFEPASIRDLIVAAAGRQLVDQIRTDVRASVTAAVTAAIQAEVTTIVRDALATGTLQRTNEFGTRLGDPKPLTELILEVARDYIGKPTGDSFARNRTTLLQKTIAEEVGAAFKKDLQTEVAKAREAARAAVSAAAADVVKETIERATRSL